MGSKHRVLIGSLAMLAVPSAAQAVDEVTQFRTINEVLVSGSAYYATALPGSPWSTASCPTISYLYIPRADPASSELLATLLTVKGGGFQLSAVGNCSEIAGYFRTNYLIAK